MSMYGNNDLHEYNEVSNYIRNDFLDFCLNEKVKEIKEDIVKYRETGIGQEDIFKKLAKLTDEKSKAISNLAKEKLMESYLEAFRYRNIYKESLDTDNVADTLLEYSGDKYKNEQFKKTLQEIEKYFIAYVKEIEILDNMLVKVTGYYNKSKNVNTARKAYTEAVKECKAGAKSINSLFESLNTGTNPFTKFQSQAGSFNNKYSSVTMEEKKMFDSKIKDYIDNINNIIEPWAGNDGKNGPKIQALIDSVEKFQENMPELGDKAAKLPYSYYEYMFKAYKEDMYICQYIRKKLGLEIEGSFKWKIVHALFKG